MESPIGEFLGGILGFVIWFGLAWIPANIARNKGYVFGKWYIYGFFLWLPALIHSLLLPRKLLPPLKLK